MRYVTVIAVAVVLSIYLLAGIEVEATKTQPSLPNESVLAKVRAASGTQNGSDIETQEGDNNKATSKEEEVTKDNNGTIIYQGVQLLRVTFKSKEEREFIKSLESSGEVETWLNTDKVADVLLLFPHTLKSFQDKKLQYEVVIDNLQRAIEEENPHLSDEEVTELEGRKGKARMNALERQANRNEILIDWVVAPYSPRGSAGVGFTSHNLRFGFEKFTLPSKKGFRGKGRKRQRIKKKGYRLTWQMYHRMVDIHGYMDYLAATYPQNVTITTIGRSVEGRPLKVLSYTSGKPNLPAIWVDAGIHAREWITPASLTYIINQMIEGGDGARNIDWYFQPLINPDGYEHSHSRDRLWRKNRAHPEMGSCAGIDLNRNFGYKWGGQGASRQPCRETFAGSGPFSEPETAAIQKFINSKQGQIMGYVSLHSYGQYILYPWGYDRKVPADYQDLERVGLQMATAIRKVGGKTYTVGAAANTLYPASGGSDDWAKGSAKIKYAYTIELPDTGRHGFLLPAQHIVPSAKDAYAALQVLAQELSK